MTRRQPLGPWVPWLVLAAFGASTVLGTVYVSQSVRQRDQLRFEIATQDFRGALLARIDPYVALLRAGSALFAATDRVDRAQFHAFVEHLELPTQFPGMLGFGFAAVVQPQTVAAVEADLQRQGARDFRVWPMDPPRDLYTSIVFLEPLDRRNEAALGYDMFSNPTRREAMILARDTGRAVASGKVRLKQEIDPDGEQAGFLIYLAVYRGAVEPETERDRVATLEGFVYAPFRAGDLLGTLLTAPNDRMLAVRIYDGDTTAAHALLYASAPGEDLSAARFRSVTRLRIAERRWTVEMAARPDFGGTSPVLLPTIFGLGLVTALLMFVLTGSEARARASAEGAADALRRSEEELRAASRAKDEFLATLSHELRTPLNAVLGWARMLRTGRLPESRRENALAVIERNARVQAQLIEDLLDVSRIITGKLRLELRPIALNPALEEAVNTVRPSAEAKGVTLACTPDPAAAVVYASPERLQQIVWNLLSNAIKFTPAGGRVELAARRSDANVQVTVRDTGIGIAPSFLPHVFERFHQADSSTTRSHSGVGLGLAIVRHLVELHGGAIEAESAGEGRGATFTVTLPLHRADATGPVERAPRVVAASVAPDGPGPQFLDGVRVLVVDDERDARELAHDALAQQGASVAMAASVDEALTALDDGAFDVIVTDLAMPGLDGYGLMARLRREGSTRLGLPPVIAMTAYARPADRERVFEAGFEGFLGKPIELDKLTALVAELAARRRGADGAMRSGR